MHKMSPCTCLINTYILLLLYRQTLENRYVECRYKNTRYAYVECMCLGAIKYYDYEIELPMSNCHLLSNLKVPL